MKLKPKAQKLTIKEYRKRISQVTNHIAVLEVERLVLTLELQKLYKAAERKSKAPTKEK